MSIEFAKILKKHTSLPIASLVLVAISLGTLSPAVALNESDKAFDFAACVAAQGSGSVMVLMDESDTVYGANGKPASDPTNLRVAGAQLLIDDIQRVVDATAVPINVQLAGFGDNFVVRSSGWKSIKPGDQGATAEELKTATNAFSARPSDGNQIETDFWSGIDGARKQFDSQGQCRLLVVFKDGMDFQKFDAKNSSEHLLPEVQKVLEEAAKAGSVTKARQAAELAKTDMCRPQGLADGLRGDGIFTISVGLGAGDFSDLQAFTQNSNSAQSCGVLPGRGYLLKAEDPRDLINLFARTLNPSNLPEQFDGSFTFEMSPALSTISIVTSGMTSAGQYFITPPLTCPSAARTLFNATAAQSAGSFGTGVDWNGAGYAAGEALRVFIKRSNTANLECWSGVWTVDPGTEARSSLSIDADLQPVAVFETRTPSVQPGQSILMQALLRKISSPAEMGSQGLQGLTGEDLHPDLNVSVTGSVYDPQGTEVLQLFGGEPLSANELGQVEEIQIPDSWPLGSYLVRLTLSLDVEGIDINLNDVRSESILNIRGPIPLPSFDGVVLFPAILGSSPSSTTIEITNSAEKPISLDFRNSRVSTSQSPVNASEYRVFSSSDTLEIGPGETLSLELSLAPNTSDQVTFAGQVSGFLNIPVTAAGEKLPEGFSLEIPFKSEQLPDQNLLLLILFTILFLLLGTALTAGAMWLVNYRVSRFPKSRKIQENVLQSVTLPALIDASGLRLMQALPSFESDLWQPLNVANRRSISTGYSQIRAKSPGLRLGRVGFAELADPSVVGWGMSGSGIEVDRKRFRPRLGLDLQQNFFVSIRPEDIQGSSPMDTSIPAQVTFISSLNSFEGNEDLVESARTSTSEVLESLIASIQKRAGLVGGRSSFGSTVDPFSENNSQNSFNQNSDPFA